MLLGTHAGFKSRVNLTILVWGFIFVIMFVVKSVVVLGSDPNVLCSLCQAWAWEDVSTRNFGTVSSCSGR